MRDRKGQVLIELAVVLPVILLFLFAIVDYARLYHAKNCLTAAARCGARAASVIPGVSQEASQPLTAATSTPAIAVQSSVSVLKSPIPSDMQYQLRILNPATGTPISGAAQSGHQVEVTVSWSVPLITPLNSMLALVTGGSAQGTGAVAVSGQASMRYE